MHGEVWLRLQVVACGAVQGLGVARGGPSQAGRLVEEFQRLGGGKPLAGFTGCGCDQVVQEPVLGQLGVLFGEAPKGGDMGVGLIGEQRVLVERFGAATGLEQFYFGEAGDGCFAGGAACALAQVGDGFIDLASGRQHFGAPDQVGPDRVRVHVQQLQDLIVAVGLEQGAVAEGGAREESVGAALSFSQDILQGWQELVGPGTGQFPCGAQIAPVITEGFDVGGILFLDGLEQAIEPLLAHLGADRCLADQGRQLLDRGVGGVAQGA